jgi:glycine/D-amino acid oxidase-like deaminating enzyme
MRQDEPTLNFSHSTKIFDPRLAKPVTLLGAGSVGSHVAMFLAKKGVSRLTVYDHDSIESHNVPASEYWQRDIGRYKVEALREMLREAACVEIDARRAPFTGGEPLERVVVACVDTMKARKAIWERLRSKRAQCDLYIDTRISKELVEVYAVHPDDPEDAAFYEHFIGYTDEEANLDMCGAHGIKYVAATAARAAVANLTSFWMRGTKKRFHQELVVDLVQIA